MDTFRIRKVADKEAGERVVRYDSETGAKKLVNPATPGDDHESWPMVGVEFVGDPPALTSASHRYVDTACREGWMSRVNERAVVRPAGKTMKDWNGNAGTPHTFIQCDEIVVHTLAGDVRYKVVKQPDKYLVGDDEATVTPDAYELGNTTVYTSYRMERIDG